MKFLKPQLLFLLCSLYILNAAAQGPVIFKVKYLPNRKYVSSTKISSDMTMNFTGKKEYLDEMKKKGIQLPMLLKGETFLSFTVNTGAPDLNNSFPVVLKYTDTWSKQTVNSKAVSANQSPLFGQSIYGHSTPDGKLEVDSIPTKKISDTLKTSLTKIINGLSQQIKFPDKPLNIGDKFTQELPFSIPVSGMSMDMIIKIVYTYINNLGDVAKFNVEQNISYNFSKKDAKVELTGSATGTGDGVLEYYISQNMIKRYNSNLGMAFKMNVNDMVLTGDAKVTTDNSYTIASK